MATAIRLLARGHSVTVLEARDSPGGRAYTYRQDGFTFDGGPTVITAPWMLDDLFALHGRRRSESVEFRPLDPFYRIFFDDGHAFDYLANIDQFEAEITKLGVSPEDIDGYRRFLRLSERIFDKGFTELADKPFTRLGDMLRIVPSLFSLQSYRSVYGLVSRFVRDDRLRQILSFHTLLIGGNPFTSTSIYALIHHLERRWGVWYAMGGTGAIVDAMAELIESTGGELRVSSPVASIDVDGRRARSVTLATGECIDADVVVSNVDPAITYGSLAGGRRSVWTSRTRFSRASYSMSLAVIYFGTDRTYRDDPRNRLHHHNIILGPRYKGLLDDIFRRKHLAEDFSLYLHMPTFTDRSLAPEGGESFYVLAPVPHLGGQVNWDSIAKPYRDAIMTFLEERYLPDLTKHIVTERMIDPRHFRDVLGSELGSAFSLEPVLTQSAWFRPHNQSPDIDNLYLVGAGTHPGAGVPGVLSSAAIVDKLIADGLGRHDG
jgi:phytoene desaturase